MTQTTQANRHLSCMLSIRCNSMAYVMLSWSRDRWPMIIRGWTATSGICLWLRTIVLISRDMDR